MSSDLSSLPPLPPKRRRRTHMYTNGAAQARWERDYKCVQMRAAAVEWKVIAEVLGYASPGHANDRYTSFMKEYPRQDVEQLRDQQMLQIELKMRQLEPKCEAGDPRAVEVWNKLAERFAKLSGADRPEKKEVTVLTESTVDNAIKKLSTELAIEAQKAGVDLSELEELA